MFFQRNATVYKIRARTNGPQQDFRIQLHSDISLTVSPGTVLSLWDISS